MGLVRPRPSRPRRRDWSIVLLVTACVLMCVRQSCFAAPSAPSSDKIGEARASVGFRIELVYAPKLDSQGSWVSMTIDDRGRLLASDQYGGIYRIEPSPLGKLADKTRVTKVPVDLGAAQGMAFANGALYVMVNGQIGERHSGLYRVTDSNGDDELDFVESLLPMQGAGEHGPHAVVASPDGESLYLSAGNYSPSPRFTSSRVPAGWGEDQLLPRLDDPAAQGTGIPAPGGWIVRVNSHANECELFSVGFRNIYDMAFNADGELFTFESDLDVDIGTPWYRPPSLMHVISGADYGWRGGDGLWPPSYPETLPPVATAPPGSPTGLAFGAATKFPEQYKNALFAGDWSRGLIYAFFLAPIGSSYRAQIQTLAEGVTGVTDLVVRPQDGALYFTVGGRKTQSGLYRIVWTGNNGDSAGNGLTNALDAGIAMADPEAERAREARRALEEFHAAPHANADLKIWPSLSSPDRFIRYAALTGLERTDSLFWSVTALKEPNVLGKFTALIALARRDQPAQPEEWVDAFLDVGFGELEADAQMIVIRAAALGVMRFNNLTPAMLEKLGEAVVSWYPAQNDEVNHELAKLLVRLRSTTIIDPLVQKLQDDGDPTDAIDAAVTLSAATAGWTPDYRTALLDWFDSAAERDGQRSFYPYLVAARRRFIAGFSANEKAAFANRLAAPTPTATDERDLATRPFVKEWTAAEIAELVSAEDAAATNSPDAIVGRRLYGALQCAACHAIAGEGSSVGPDLKNLRGRYSVADLARAIVEPSNEIPDLYRQTTFVANGRSVTGRVTNMNATTLYVTTDMRDPGSAVELARADLESQTPSPVSPMPTNLLNTLTGDEIVALFEFLRANSSADSDEGTLSHAAQ
jgi:putative heme-binding domain-containing protein